MNVAACYVPPAVLHHPLFGFGCLLHSCFFRTCTLRPIIFALFRCQKYRGSTSFSRIYPTCSDSTGFVRSKINTSVSELLQPGSKLSSLLCSPVSGYKHASVRTAAHSHCLQPHVHIRCWMVPTLKRTTFLSFYGQTRHVLFSPRTASLFFFPFPFLLSRCCCSECVQDLFMSPDECTLFT